jgi:hypothetical protein
MNTKREIKTLLTRASKVFAGQTTDCIFQFSSAKDLLTALEVGIGFDNLPDISMCIRIMNNNTTNEVLDTALLHRSLLVYQPALHLCFEEMHTILNKLEKEFSKKRKCPTCGK